MVHSGGGKSYVQNQGICLGDVGGGQSTAYKCAVHNLLHLALSHQCTRRVLAILRHSRSVQVRRIVCVTRRLYASCTVQINFARNFAPQTVRASMLHQYYALTQVVQSQLAVSPFALHVVGTTQYTSTRRHRRCDESSPRRIIHKSVLAICVARCRENTYVVEVLPVTIKM